mgnify:CR=1 FL=1
MTSADATEVLRVDCAARAFGGRPVLRSASLRAMRGHVVALVGRNGAGKSTLLRIAAGLVTADSGTVHFGGRAWLRPEAAAFARLGMFVWPEVEALARTWTVGRQLTMVADRFDGDARAAAERAGVVALLDRRPDQLSGGERRRAEVALAFARRPMCLLADEPFRGLAPIDAEWLAGALRALAAQGCAVVVTAHEVEALFAAADTVTWCTAGTTYELGSPARARCDERFRREYLGGEGSNRR